MCTNWYHVDWLVSTIIEELKIRGECCYKRCFSRTPNANREWQESPYEWFHLLSSFCLQPMYGKFSMRNEVLRQDLGGLLGNLAKFQDLVYTIFNCVHRNCKTNSRTRTTSRINSGVDTCSNFYEHWTIVYLTKKDVVDWHTLVIEEINYTFLFETMNASCIHSIVYYWGKGKDIAKTQGCLR